VQEPQVGNLRILLHFVLTIAKTPLSRSETSTSGSERGSRAEEDQNEESESHGCCHACCVWICFKSNVSVCVKALTLTCNPSAAVLSHMHTCACPYVTNFLYCVSASCDLSCVLHVHTHEGQILGQMILDAFGLCRSAAGRRIYYLLSLRSSCVAVLRIS
jgi:hypothetical protein